MFELRHFNYRLGNKIVFFGDSECFLCLSFFVLLAIIYTINILPQFKCGFPQLNGDKVSALCFVFYMYTG